MCPAHVSPAADVAALVAATVQRHPHLPALELDEQTVTYQQLWDLAGELAVSLATSTARECIGLQATRTLRTYAGYLAILRLGRTVVPLSATAPPAWITSVVTACGIDTILVGDTLDTEVASNFAGRGLHLHTETADVGLEPGPAEPAPNAYILFTSGSTGRPKGVPVAHSCVATYLPYVVQRYEIGPGSRLSQNFELTFDPSVHDLFAAWSSGATVVAPRPAEVSSPTDYVRRAGITHWCSVPSVASVADQFGELEPDSMPSLRWSTFCGERLTWDLAAAWRAAAPDSVIENAYGPTETTITCSHFRLPDDRASWPETSNGTVPIGPVYPHLDQLIVDEDGRPASEGELLIRGSQVFAGYLDDMSNEGRFAEQCDEGRVVDWPADRPIDRRVFYRTGDMVRQESAGLVHLGRTDRQVKLSGYRIELGEVENAVRSHRDVDEAVALVVDGALTVCFVGEPLPDAVVKGVVRQRLPGYMVPSATVHLDRLPLTSNGKIDRVELQSIAASRAGARVSGARATSYWRTALAELPEPMYWGREGEPGARAVVTVPLSERQTTATREFARARDLEVATLVEGAFALLMAGYDGRLDVCFGVTSTWGALPSSNGMSSSRLPTLPVRVRLDLDQRVPQFLEDLQSERCTALGHEPVTRSALEACGRPGGEHGLFDVALDLSAWGDRHAALGTSDVPAGGLGPDPSAISVRVLPGRQWDLDVYYDVNRFDESDARQLAKHLGRMMAQLVEEEESELRDLSLSRPLGFIPLRVDSQPAPGPDMLDAEVDHRPLSVIESLLADVWRDVLGAHEVGRNDNFFDLGGDSVSSIRMVTAAAAAGVRLTPRLIFENPTVGALALAAAEDPSRSEPLPSTSPPSEKVALLEPDVLAAIGVGRDDVVDAYPCGPVQMGMLFHSVYRPGETAYLNQTVMVFHGHLDLKSLEAAWQDVVARHDALRTSFDWAQAREPVQLVRGQVQVPFDVRRDATAADLDLFLEQDRARGIDPAQAPLMRVTVFVESPDLARVVWTWHHMLMDGWSLSIVVDEISAAYAAQTAGRPVDLPQAPSYREYVAWLARQDMGRAESFWRSTLDGVPALPVAEMSSPSGFGECSFFMSEESTSLLSAFARDNRLTTNTVVQGAFAAALATERGVGDICIGITSSGRPADVTGMESMVGMFLATTPLRVRVDPGSTVLDLLSTVQADQLSARQFEYASLSKIQSWSAAGPSGRLFDALLVFENHPPERTSTFEADERQATYTSYPLMLTVTPGDRLRFQFEYQLGSYSEAGVRALSDRLARVLRALVENPGLTVAHLPVPAPPELSSATDDVSGNTRIPAASTVTELFERRAATTPDAVALVHGERTLTYRALEDRANLLAYRLRSRATGPRSRIGLCLDVSLEAVVASLGILKAGAAYVPLDPTWADDHLRRVVAETDVQLVVSGGPLGARLGSLGIDTLLLEEADPPAKGPVPGAAPVGVDDIACITYTSNAAHPQGVMVDHRMLYHTASAAADLWELGEDDRLLQVAPMSSGWSFAEVFAPLLRSASIDVGHVGLRQDLLTLSDLSGSGATVVQLPALHWHALVDSLDEGTVTGEIGGMLRLVQLCGDRVDPRRLRTWSSRIGSRVRVTAAYGTAETAYSLIAGDLRTLDEDVAVLPAGRPVPHARVHVLDPRLRPTAVGVTGELYAGGDGVVRGYLGRSGVDGAFVDDPFRPGERLFRTGDLAARLPSGEVELRSRIDRRLMIDGVLTDLGAVEAAVVADPRVRDCVVVSPERGGPRRLEAYVVLRGEAPVSELREELSQRVPEHAVPARIVAVDALPLTERGRLDRRALLRLGDATVVTPASTDGARTAEERVLIEIWEKVLGIDHVATDESFFELGGDSISSIRVVALAISRGLQLSAGDVFEHPTIGELAKVASQVSPAETSVAPSLSPLVSGDVMAKLSAKFQAPTD